MPPMVNWVAATPHRAKYVAEYLFLYLPDAFQVFFPSSGCPALRSVGSRPSIQRAE